MKTFKEHKERIKTFGEKLNEKTEDTKDLMKDFQNLGVHEDTFSLSDIEDAWGSVITEKNLVHDNISYYSINENPTFETNVVELENEAHLEVTFRGSIEVEDVNVDVIVEEIMGNLESYDNNFKQKRWKLEDIEEALGDVGWDRHILAQADEAEAEITDVSYDGEEATIEYAIKEGSYFVTADVVDMWDEFKDLLDSYE